MLDKWCIFMRLLRPSARGISTCFGDEYSDPHPRQRSLTRGVDVYFGDDYFGLHHRRHGSNQGVRHLLQRRLLQPSPSRQVRFEGFAIYFGDEYSDPHPHRRISTRGADVYFSDDYFGIHPRRLVRLVEPVAYLVRGARRLPQHHLLRLRAKHLLQPPLRTLDKRGYGGTMVD
jgi:hypothetical protein